MKKFIVFGLGISGNEAVKFLLNQGFVVVVGDDNLASITGLNHYLKDNQNLKSNLQIAQNIEQINWENAQFLILAAGIPLKYPTPHKIVLEAAKHNCKIVCDVEILYLFNQQANFIGITGTNGKSTTTALTAHIFAAASESGGSLVNKKSVAGGNIGIAALALPSLGVEENYIIEMSSYQLDLIDQTRFHIAELLNITPDHLDRHKDMDGYIAAKKRIFLNQKSGDFAVIDIDNENSKKVYQDLMNDKNFEAKLIPISNRKIVEGGVSMIGDVIYNNINQSNSSKIDLGERQFLKGDHNAQNIAFAFAACVLSGIYPNEIVASIKTFKGLKHRMQVVEELDNIKFINDSKATNADSTKNSLKSYDNIYWIVGGKPKDGGIASLESYFPKIKYAFLIGEATENFAKTLENKVEYFKCDNLENAFNMAYNKALNENQLTEKNILLSPACASFDQWKNFEERGDFFIKLTQNIVDKN